MASEEEDRDFLRPQLGYPIVVGRHVTGALRTFARERAAGGLVVFDDRPPLRRLASAVASRLGYPGRGIRLSERTKNLRTAERVLDAMLVAGLERSSLLVGVGGGVASDVFGFSATTYMRGIAYAHVATSLTAMVDAAIGGKTGVNLRETKAPAAAPAQKEVAK